MIAINTTHSISDQVDEQFERYLSWMSDHGNQPSTVTARRKTLSKTLVQLNVTSMSQLTSGLIQGWLDQLSVGYAKRTVVSQLDSLKHFLKWLVSNGDLVVDPTDGHAFNIEADDNSIGRFQFKFQRLFWIIEFLTSRRMGATIDLIHEFQCGRSQLCMRTTRRDLELLANLGFVTRKYDEYVGLNLYSANYGNQFFERIELKRTYSVDNVTLHQ